MAISSLDSVVSLLSAGTERYISNLDLGLVSYTPSASDKFWASVWNMQGGASGTQHLTSSSTGALTPLPTPAVGASLYLGSLSLASSFLCFNPMWLYDRVWQGGGVTSSTLSTFNTTAWQRTSTSGVGVEAFLEMDTNTSSSSPTTGTLTYTNSSGVSGRTGSVAYPGNNPQAVRATMLPVQLAAGDIGIQSVQTFKWTSSTGSTSTVVLLQRIAMVDSGSCDRDVFQLGKPFIDPHACLSWAAYNVAALNSNFRTEIRTVLQLIEG